MTEQIDPWRTLGLAPGSSADEVRRAYRRLAKENHPDAAGESAVPRFLAIQAAYEILIRPSVRRRPGARPPGSGGSTGPASEPWRADPDRARASGRADGRRPGARPTGTRPSGAAAAGAGTDGGAGAAGTASSMGASRSTSSAGSSRARRPSGRRRAPNKATPYSTSYDPADEEPFEPGWSGAGWYGAASGTYWTINPKEWADPRKHGPEYQRRARRTAAGGWILEDAPEVSDPAAGDSGDRDGVDAETPRPEETWTEAATDADSPLRDTAPAPEAPARPQPDWRSWFETPPPGARFRGPVLRMPTSGIGRLVVAFGGWIGLAAAASALIGEATGCSRFSATCGDEMQPVPPLVAAALFLFLLALPRVATWLAHGTIATLLIGVPAAILLSATGGARQPEASAAVITIVADLAWVAGVVYAVVVPRLGGNGATYHAGDEPPPRHS